MGVVVLRLPGESPGAGCSWGTCLAGPGEPGWGGGGLEAAGSSPGRAPPWRRCMLCVGHKRAGDGCAFPVLRLFRGRMEAGGPEREGGGMCQRVVHEMTEENSYPNIVLVYFSQAGQQSPGFSLQTVPALAHGLLPAAQEWLRYSPEI